LDSFCSTWPRSGVNFADGLDSVAEEVDAQRLFVIVGGENFHDVPPDPEGAAVEIDVVPLVLDFDEFPQQVVPPVLFPW